MSHEKFQTCIDLCLECAVECDHCASSCLKETEVQMLAKCIQLDRECAEMCYSAARIMTLGSTHAGEICKICVEFCQRCAGECERHTHMEHCRKCADACRNCAEECERMAKELVH